MSYLADALRVLIEFASSIVLAWLLLRLLTEFWRADFGNPLCQFLYRSTHRLIAPLARVLPSTHRINLAVVLLALLVSVLKVVLLYATYGALPSFAALALRASTELIDFLLLLYIVLIIAWAVLATFAAQTRHPIVPPLGALTQPLLRPLARRMPTPGGIDFSPAIAVLVIVLLRIVLLRPILDLAARI